MGAGRKTGDMEGFGRGMCGISEKKVMNMEGSLKTNKKHIYFE
jgi:hypothetical protein